MSTATRIEALGGFDVNCQDGHYLKLVLTSEDESKLLGTYDAAAENDGDEGDEGDDDDDDDEEQGTGNGVGGAIYNAVAAVVGVFSS